MPRTAKHIRSDFEKHAKYHSNRINHPYSIATSDYKTLVAKNPRNLFLQFEKHERKLK